VEISNKQDIKKSMTDRHHVTDSIDSSYPPSDDEKDSLISPASIRFMIAARVLRGVLNLAIIIIVLSAVMILVAAPDQRMRTVPNLVAVVPIAMVWFLLRRGRVMLASHLLLAALVIAFLSGMILNGGVMAPSYIAFLPLIVVTSWFYGRRPAIFFSLAVMAIGALFVWLSSQGYLREAPPKSPLVMWFLISIHMVVCLVATVIPNQMLHRALAESEGRRKESEKARQQEKKAAQELAEREKALRESEQRLGVLTDNLPSTMLYQIVMEPNGKRRFTYVSQNVMTLNEVSAEDALADPGLLYHQVHPEDVAFLAEMEDKALANMRPFRCEARFILPSGKLRWFQLTSSPRKLSDGAVAWDGLQIDITDRKQAEEEKIRLESRLKRAEKMEALGTLAGGVAHDLNNILTGIVSLPELLLLQVPDESPLCEPIKTIQSSGKKAAAVVQDLLTLARRGVASTRVVNLSHIVSDYMRSPEHKKLMSIYPDVVIETHFEKGLMNILGSPIHLSKTIMNLVSNAAEAIDGSGKIRISTENRYIDKPISSYDKIIEGDYVALAVSDTGVGISPENKEKIFEPFYTSKNMGRSGSGLGMAVVWGSVKDHNGYIDVDSSEGKGTTFKLYFPVTREKLSGGEGAFSIDQHKGRGESILVVDDVESQREIASMILRQLGYSPAVVSSGEEAIEYIKENEVDLIILDMIMDPGMDGLDTYKSILDIRPGQKALIVSGFSDTDRVKEAQKLGAGQYVKKPYTLEKMGIAVKEELKR
jgi:PAS domain S-box-containing protein